MKDYFKKLIERKKKELAELKKRNEESEDIKEVKSIGTQIESVSGEIKEAETQLKEMMNNERKEVNKENEENRSKFNPNKALNVISTVEMNGKNEDRSEDSRATMEYRKAFMNYMTKGEIDRNVLQFEARANATGTSADLGVLIPTTVIQKIITDVEKVYGQLYSRVLKTNLRGGVKYPIGSFSATFKRITENGPVSDRQDAGGVTGSVEFSYNIGEIRIARTLLQVVLSVDAFEEKFAEVVAKTYVQAMDKEIMNGNPDNNEMTGILTEAAKGGSGRIPTANIIEFTDEEMADWKSWQTKLFAKIPLSMRSLRPEFVMTANTYEANIKTLADDNKRPVYAETYNPVDGTETSTFKARPVVFVENDVLNDFNDATDGQYFGMYWVPEEAYAINTNYEFTVVDYFDHETNQQVKKALVINDGKVIDGKYIYLLKKKVTG